MLGPGNEEFSPKRPQLYLVGDKGNDSKTEIKVKSNNKRFKVLGYEL
jgi:hypothetical protein